MLTAILSLLGGGGAIGAAGLALIKQFEGPDI